jgi:hypothetical protein
MGRIKHWNWYVNSSSTLIYSDIQNTVNFYLEKYVIEEIGVEL